MNVAIVGCGLIGKKRALALSSDDTLVGCCDTNAKAMEEFSRDFHCAGFHDVESLFRESPCESVIVAVVNKFARDIVVRALRDGKHVLAEKPLGRNAAESRLMVEHSSSCFHFKGNLSPLTEGDREGPVLKTGFNHRFHPAISRAKILIEEGVIGRVISIRGRYGHGGRPGMEMEWRASKDLCGGGELLDQGIHMIDLVRWFGGEIDSVFGKVETKFWKMEVEDSAAVILTTSQSVTASIHVSWFNWKNIFSLEVFGTSGYVRVEGLGGNYGPETLEIGRRKIEGGRPDIETISYGPEDISWKEEWREFKAAIRENREPVASGYDGLKANEVIQAIYESNANRRVISLS